MNQSNAPKGNFPELSIQDLQDILSITIKKDDTNKIITFLCMLSAYTEGDQFNVSFNAPSSAGKSYIPTEIARLFPQEDVRELGYCSPMAFVHESGAYDKKENRYTVDMSRKVYVFLDQPHMELLARLRPLLSHDKKEIEIKITDRDNKSGLRTKNVTLIGYPSVIFCTAGMKIDEQEATRFLLLSPDVDQEKIRHAVHEVVKKSADAVEYDAELNSNEQRNNFKNRIKVIRDAAILNVNIEDGEYIENKFVENCSVLKPRHNRDIKRLLSIIKSFALLNMWHRKIEGKTLFANRLDIDNAFAIWEEISPSQELNLPPHMFRLYKEVVLGAWKVKNAQQIMRGASHASLSGVTRQEIMKMHYEVYARAVDQYQLRQQILPMLEMANLITQEIDPGDKRQKLVYPMNILSDEKE